MERWHETVLLKETIDLIKVIQGGVYFDGTFGEGGHTQEIITRGGKVCAVDRDPQALERYRAEGGLREDPRLTLRAGRFSRIGEIYPDLRFDGAVLDLGVSTRQLLEGPRGFSFSQAGPLDMRMDPVADRPLGEWLDRISEKELAAALRRNADLPASDKAARRILEAHRRGELATTADLAALFRGAGKKHPATVVFMALRMLVNEEWEEVERGIPAVVERLKPGARLAVITFHSTEDRLVKRLFQQLSGKSVGEGPESLVPRPELVQPVGRKPLVPGREELRRNPRARSAKLRCVEKLPSPV